MSIGNLNVIRYLYVLCSVWCLHIISDSKCYCYIICELGAQTSCGTVNAEFLLNWLLARSLVVTSMRSVLALQGKPLAEVTPLL